MLSYLAMHDSKALQRRIDGRSPDLFKAFPPRPQLQVNCLSALRRHEPNDTLVYRQDQTIENVEQIEALSNNIDNILQVFTIRQQRSWTTLDISQGLFQEFLEKYNVYHEFWNCAFAFGRKCGENEFEFPSFRMRQNPVTNSSSIFESSCVLRRAELNNRKLTEGQSSWSIRQTAVYHRRIPILPSAHDSDSILDARRYRSVFLLISPSKSFERHLKSCADVSATEEHAMSWQNILRLLVLDTIKGWQEYMAWMEGEIKEQVRRTFGALPDVFFDPLTDFQINFIDRQTLKQLEDKVTELGVILLTMQNTVLRLCEYVRRLSSEEYSTDLSIVNTIIEELEEHTKEADMNQRRGEALKIRVKSVTQLEKTTNDAAAVKVLTVISLVYLPVTVVTNFFSTQFVRTTDSGSLQVSTGAWILAAIAIPLTILTI
ncbi:hypothetical protein K505DRAFT_189315, partial [Melanomma pulvis-pyrius CBS 109.77]